MLFQKKLWLPLFFFPTARAAHLLLSPHTQHSRQQKARESARESSVGRPIGEKLTTFITKEEQQGTFKRESRVVETRRNEKRGNKTVEELGNIYQAKVRFDEGYGAGVGQGIST